MLVHCQLACVCCLFVAVVTAAARHPGCETSAALSQRPDSLLQTQTRYEARSASRPRSLFAEVADYSIHAKTLSSTYALQDVSMAQYVNASQVMQVAISTFGTVASMVVTGMATDLQEVVTYCEHRPETYIFLGDGCCKTFVSLISKWNFVSSGVKTSILLLLRKQQFMLTYIQMLLRGKAYAARDAYALTLRQHHNYGQSFAFTLALHFLPSLDTIVGIQELAPRADFGGLRTIIWEDAGRAVNETLPMVEWMLNQLG